MMTELPLRHFDEAIEEAALSFLHTTVAGGKHKVFAGISSSVASSYQAENGTNNQDSL